MSFLEGVDFNVIKPGRRGLTPQDIMDMFNDEKILGEELLKIDDINRAYDEIGNKNIYGLSSTQTTLPRNEYWSQINQLTN